MVTSVFFKEAVFEAKYIAFIISSSLHCEGVDDVFGGHSVVDHVLELSFVIFVSEEEFFVFAVSHGFVGRTETTETVFFTTLENVVGIACCVCSCKVGVTKSISLVDSKFSDNAAAIGYFTGCTVEVDNEFEVCIFGAEVVVAGGIHEASERAYTITRIDNSVDSLNFTNTLGLCAKSDVVFYPFAVFDEPAVTGFVGVGGNVFASNKSSAHCDNAGYIVMETESVNSSTDRIDCGCGAYPNIDAVFVENSIEFLKGFRNAAKLRRLCGEISCLSDIELICEKALESGEKLDFAELLPRGRHLTGIK